MACVENMQLIHGDYEREEGEIVDELDELSDISSEEEFLLRQRLQVLENYNNVLERKKAKRTSIGPGKTNKHSDELLCDLSEISATELEEPYVIKIKDVKQQKHLKTNQKVKRRKDLSVNHLAKREYRKKSHKHKKKVVLSDSSAESEDEYRNKRRKLEEAVAVNKTKIDKTSLKARLTKMLHGSHNHEYDKILPNSQVDYQLVSEVPVMNEISSENNTTIAYKIQEDSIKNEIKDSTGLCESVDLCSDSEAKDSGINGSVESLPRENDNIMDSIKNDLVNEEKVINDTQHTGDSDEDLELLRQHALKTKIIKTKTDPLVDKDNAVEKKSSIEDKEDKDDKDMLLLSEDEDSDTTELRLICLKSALLKKAIEMKQKQKLRKRLQSANLNEELLKDQTEYINKLIPENNTDTESVDMDIGSDADEKAKESSDHAKLPDAIKSEKNAKDIKNNRSTTLNNQKEDEFEEDEDLLRANLLTSLSKNLPKLVDPKVMKTIDDSKAPQKETEHTKQVNNVPDEKRFIINIGNSDSEGEHEATKNLTKMHMKLSEQMDFQQKLDLFLKSTRMQVENSTLPDLVQKPLEAPSPKTKEKFVPKAVKHLPKSEQIEYKNLVKRMAELEKIKNARQSSINSNKSTDPVKDTLKPRNVTIDSRKLIPSNILDEQIAQSRKTIAEESAKVLKLKEEAIKLSQKYKIVATELHNISTAITLNKKEQRSAQIRLSKIRAQHKLLLNSSTTTNHSSNVNIVSTHGPQKTISTTAKRPQKENDPREDIKNPKILRTVQVSVVNDLKVEAIEPNPRLSIQVDVTSNKKTVKMPKGPGEDSTYVESRIESRKIDERKVTSTDPLDDKGGGENKSKEVITNWGSRSKINDDYKSPLQALGTANWEEDPNAVLCPFEVGGNCKDADCKYLHPKTLHVQ